MNIIEEVTKPEKAKAYSIFAKSKENRETFICACEADQESALIWLRNGCLNNFDMDIIGKSNMC